LVKIFFQVIQPKLDMVRIINIEDALYDNSLPLS